MITARAFASMEQNLRVGRWWRALRDLALLGAVFALTGLMPVCHAADFATDMATAKSEAKRWQPDAMLVGVMAALRDGALAPDRVPMFQFVSPATKQGLTVVAMLGKPMVMPGPADPAAVPIPDGFIGLTEAIAAARKQGFGPPLQASLKAYPTASGTRTVWEFAGTPTGSPGSETMYIDATSGALTSIAALSGRSAPAGAALPRAVKLPPGTPVDFASLLRQADAVAAKESPAYKLHQVEVELEGATLRITEASFHYWQPSPPRAAPAQGWEEIAVDITSPRSSMNGQRRIDVPGALNAESSEFEDPKPTTAPNGILAPDEVIRRLHRPPMASPTGTGYVVSDVSAWRIRMQLFRVGADYRQPAVQLSPDGGNAPLGRDPVFTRTAPTGKWIWWTIVQKKEADPASKTLEYLYFDPLTGALSHACAHSEGNQAAASIPCPAS